MQIRSLGFRTDLFFHRANGEVLDRGSYLVVRTPSNPGFFWGNLLYFPAAPIGGDQERWEILFQKEFADLPVHHRTYAWEGAEKGVSFPGFVLEPTTTMTGREFVKPRALNASIEVRPLVSSDDFAASLENQVASRAEHFQEAPYRVFVQRKQAGYQELIAAGKGAWMGAFIGGKLAGDLGVFAEAGLGRFQTVVTDSNFRRQGVCSTLVYESCLFAKVKFGAEILVMEADPDYHAARIYESVGFRPSETRYGLNWFDRTRWAN